MERDLVKAREAHQRALATAATLEEEIVTEPVHYLRPARCLCPLPELGLLQKKILGMELEVLQGAAGGGPCPLL